MLQNWRGMMFYPPWEDIWWPEDKYHGRWTSELLLSIYLNFKSQGTKAYVAAAFSRSQHSILVVSREPFGIFCCHWGSLCPLVLWLTSVYPEALFTLKIRAKQQQQKKLHQPLRVKTEKWGLSKTNKQGIWELTLKGLRDKAEQINSENSCSKCGQTKGRSGEEGFLVMKCFSPWWSGGCKSSEFYVW